MVGAMIELFLLVLSVVSGAGAVVACAYAMRVQRRVAVPAPGLPAPSKPTPKLPTRNERWVMEAEHELHPARRVFPEHRNCRACGPGLLRRYEVPSGFDHVYYKDVHYTDIYGWAGKKRKKKMSGPMEAEIVSSEIEGHPGWHTVMLDIDMPARLIESSTPGHHHLYIDKPIRWHQYKQLLKALSDAGVIEREFYTCSVHQGGTHLRCPWVEKEKQ